MKYRLKFVKGEEVKFIPHLDMLRLYQRAIRRANLDISYSNGFNPHQQMSFAQPLSVGFTGLSEYMDIETTKEVEINEFMTKLNSCLPCGTYVTNMRPLKACEKNAMASVEAASYYITIDLVIDTFKTKIEEFLSNTELIVQKKTKKSLKELNIKDNILKIQVIDKNKLYVLLSAGSNSNLKPNLFIECLYKYMGLQFNPYKIKYERVDLFKKEGESFINLFS